MVVNNIIKQLNDIGFSDYEAKGYIALLQNNPATAYETARCSGVPTSKIYGVMDKLEAKDAVNKVEAEGKTLYIPQDPEELINRKTREFNSLKKGLTALTVNQDISYIWNISSIDSLLLKIENIIDSAQDHILINCWPQELAIFYKKLKNKEKSGVKISIVLFGETEVKVGQIFSHPIKDTIYEEKKGRGFTLTADGKEAVIATISGDNAIEGAWSGNTGFVTLAEEYIRHDIYIMKIVKRFDSSLLSMFGINYRRLRDIFSDEEES